MAFSPDESHCATCGEDGSVRVWSLASLELVVQFQVLNQVPAEMLQTPLGSGRYLTGTRSLPGVCVSSCNSRVGGFVLGGGGVGQAGPAPGLLGGVCVCVPLAYTRRWQVPGLA